MRASLRLDVPVIPTSEVTLYSNRAETALRLGKWRAAFSDADEAVKMESLNEKAHVRRAKAARELNKHFQAIASFKSAVAINARNTEARTLLQEVETLHRLEILSKGGEDGANEDKSEKLRDRDGRLLRDDEALLRCAKIVEAGCGAGVTIAREPVSEVRRIVEALRRAKDAAIGCDPGAIAEVSKQLELLRPVSESLQRSDAVMEMLPNPLIQVSRVEPA